jgi:2-aminoethylphosphonate-pyruvate transaminase
VAARGARYRRNCDTLIEGMSALGLRPFLPRAVQAPIIVTFHAPADPAYAFKPFYEKVKARGYVLYPGKLTQVETFRVGCIGAIDDNEMRNVAAAVGETLREMGVKQAAPAKAAAVA